MVLYRLWLSSEFQMKRCELRDANELDAVMSLPYESLAKRNL